jgi:hypothetical protein
MYEDEAITIRPNQDGYLLSDFQYTLGDLLNGLWFERCAAFLPARRCSRLKIFLASSWDVSGCQQRATKGNNLSRGTSLREHAFSEVIGCPLYTKSVAGLGGDVRVVPQPDTAQKGLPQKKEPARLVLARGITRSAIRQSRELKVLLPKLVHFGADAQQLKLRFPDGLEDEKGG